MKVNDNDMVGFVSHHKNYHPNLTFLEEFIDFFISIVGGVSKKEKLKELHAMIYGDTTPKEKVQAVYELRNMIPAHFHHKLSLKIFVDDEDVNLRCQLLFSYEGVTIFITELVEYSGFNMFGGHGFCEENTSSSMSIIVEFIDFFLDWVQELPLNDMYGTRSEDKFLSGGNLRTFCHKIRFMQEMGCFLEWREGDADQKEETEYTTTINKAAESASGVRYALEGMTLPEFSQSIFDDLYLRLEQIKANTRFGQCGATLYNKLGVALSQFEQASMYFRKKLSSVEAHAMRSLSHPLFDVTDEFYLRLENLFLHLSSYRHSQWKSTAAPYKESIEEVMKAIDYYHKNVKKDAPVLVSMQFSYECDKAYEANNVCRICLRQEGRRLGNPYFIPASFDFLARNHLTGERYETRGRKRLPRNDYQLFYYADNLARDSLIARVGN